MEQHGEDDGGVSTPFRAVLDTSVLYPPYLRDTLLLAAENRHVAALAVSAIARIVTANLRDFPESALAPYGVIAQSPDQFLNSLWDVSPERIKRVVAEQAASYRRPAMSIDNLLDRLAVHAPTLVQRLRERSIAP